MDRMELSPGTRQMLRGVRVLMLEDHRDTREVYANGLRRQGAEVLEAASAQVAMLMVQQEKPDVLVVDLELPDVDGRDFLRAVRALPPDAGGRTPAVALTVHNQQEVRAQSIFAGFQLHLAKPMDPLELARLLAGLLGSRNN
jgi:CheY-like chemotaxis protein